MFLTTMALSALANTMLDAAYLFGYRKKAHSNGHTNPVLQARAKEAYAFISGTGLDIMIEYYKLDYNAEEIRTQFCGHFKTSV